MQELDVKLIERTAQGYHYKDMLEELEYYQELASMDKRISLLINEATKEVCQWYEIPFDDYVAGNVVWGLKIDYSEFLLELVNNIAEWLGIDNYGGYIYE
jgi:hypothetical protein